MNASSRFTNQSSVDCTVMFSEPVTGVASGAFTRPATGTVVKSAITVTPVSPSVYTVTVSGVTGNGTLGLNLVDDSTIRDLAGNPLTALTASASFQTQSTFVTGSGPSSVTVGDVNGDGQPDLIAANNGGDSVSVLLGNGNGNFTGQVQAIDTTVPTATITSFGNSGYTNLSSPQFTTVVGTVVDNTAVASVAISLHNSAGNYWNGTTFSGTTETFSIAVTGTTSWTASIPASLTDGVYTVHAQATDTAGNTGLSTTSTFSVDKTNPNAPTFLATPASFTSNTSASFSFTATDPTAGSVSSGVASYLTNLDSAGFVATTSPTNYTGLAVGSHTFQVQAIDTAGNVSEVSSYNWTVGTVPTVTTNPTNCVVTVGGLASFTAAASGSPTPTMQWQVSTNGTTWSDITDATSATYSFTTTISNSGFQYRAVFTNAIGNVATDAATLTVQKAGQTITFGSLESVTYGHAAITLGATSSSSLPVSYSVVSGAGHISDGTLVITGAGSIVVQADQAGNTNYNAAGSVQQTLTVSKATATITVTPYAVIYDGNAHTATGTATGVGSANLNSGLTLSGTTHTSIGAYNNDAWSFHDAAGNYNDASGTINNLIGSAPVVTGQPANSTVTAGVTATFTVVATGFPAPTIQWQVSTNGGSSWSMISGATAGTYSISTILSNQGSQYRAVLTNVLGVTTTNAATLTVNGRPFSVLATYTTTAFTGLNTGSINLVDIFDSLGVTLPTTYTATINWGDGQTDSNIAVAHPNADGTTVRVLGSHTYTTKGTYHPIITLFSADGALLTTVSGNTANLIVGTDGSNKVSITRSSPIKNRTTGLWAQTVTINNNSGIDLTGNIDFLLIGLTAGVSLSGATGYTAGGANPYVRFSTNGLKAGKSISLVLKFVVPTPITSFNYTFKTFTN